MPDTIQTLCDRIAIQEVLLRYCRGVDRRDWELVRATFFEDCTDEHADFQGQRDDFIAWLNARHQAPGFLKSTHLLGNCLIEFASSRLAVVETYFTAKLELAADAGGHREMLVDRSREPQADANLRVEILGRYLDRFERRAGEWRVAHRRTVFDSMNSQRVGHEAGQLNPAWVLGTRDSRDPVFVARREAGLH